MSNKKLKSANISKLEIYSFSNTNEYGVNIVIATIITNI